MVLVPATMELLGDRNWWLPSWLDRLLPRIHVDGQEGAPINAEEIDTGVTPDEDRVPMTTTGQSR